MTPDQLRLDETHAWLDRARRDLRAAKLLVAGQAYAESLFHCQQAVEKALKAFLTFHQKPFRKTHVLGDLNPECLAIEGSLQSVLDQTDSLSQYAWRFRYPGVSYEPDASEAADGLQKAEAVVCEIEHLLSPGA
jgi:HEPN domain-containing protein